MDANSERITNEAKIAIDKLVRIQTSIISGAIQTDIAGKISAKFDTFSTWLLAGFGAGIARSEGQIATRNALEGNANQDLSHGIHCFKEIGKKNRQIEVLFLATFSLCLVVLFYLEGRSVTCFRCCRHDNSKILLKNRYHDSAQTKSSASNFTAPTGTSVALP